jgi:hypothetical protein
MSKLSAIHPKFVEFIPRDLERGTLYISEKYKTATHICACGWCGEKVVTPLSPVDWELKKDGGLVSLSPSIGNWRLPCKSHYWIRENRIQWARSFSAREIEQVMARDQADKQLYIDRVNDEKSAVTPPRGGGLLQAVVKWFRSFFG